MHPGGRVYTARPPRRVQRLDSETMEALTRCTESLVETATEQSCRLLACTTGPRVLRSTTKSTFTIDRDWVAIPVSLDWVIKLPRMPDEDEPLAELHNTMSQPDLDIQRAREERNHPGQTQLKRSSRSMLWTESLGSAANKSVWNRKSSCTDAVQNKTRTSSP